ncbi:SH3 domain-containing kinase-binding protein 1-like isoform X2 [Corticium candelabrum]|uniref:SH3 domain-containing kinase-binding protein 1-like isoform X2 n=1 Tax=Corticium candelabrum TaxID=121492 RepID=UPI002E271376|nr:SH3 domain-containing kinase-binding protein 1-like isoform X2 [Corticium candelabrum]
MVECRVTFEYEKENDDELTLRVGDIITNVDQQDGGWWEGNLNGIRGVFPDNFVEVIQKSAPPARPPDASRAAKKEWRAKVTYSYAAENEDELDLEVGDEVVVTNQEEEGWWEGIMNGRRGVFPSNFVETIDEESPFTSEIKETPKSPEKKEPPKLDEPEGPLNPPPEEEVRQIQPVKVIGVGFGNIFSGGPIKLQKTAESRKPTAPNPPGQDKKRPAPGPPPHSAPLSQAVLKKRVEKCKVVFDYVAEASDELSLKIGDIIEIVRKDVADGWWEGKLGGKVGVFPDNFVEIIAAEEEKPPPPVPTSSSTPPSAPVSAPTSTPAPAPTPAPVQLPVNKLKPVEKPDKPDDKPVEKVPLKPAVKPPPPKPLSNKPPPPVGRKPPSVAFKKPEDKPLVPAGKKPVVAALARKPETSSVSTEKPQEDNEKPLEKKENVPVPDSKLRHPTVDRPRNHTRPPSRYAVKKDEEGSKAQEAADNVAPWQKEIQKKRTTSNVSIGAKVDDVGQESPTPEKPASVPTFQPQVSKPTSPAPKAPLASSQEGSEQVAALQRDLEALKQEFASLKKKMEENIDKLESELDEEKMERMKLQVEVDRLKKKNPSS